MPKKKPDQIFIVQAETSTVQIHVTGDSLPNSVFLQILEHMKAHKDNAAIVFVVYDAKMMLLIRQAIPTELYVRIEIDTQKEGLKSAG